jgi:tRNA (cytidine/uridine-2'-O-)-methyltransferase
VDADRVYTDVSYVPGDCLLFGPESVGLPDEVKALDWVTERLRLPMIPGVRSLNLANTASVVVYEAWRQQGFSGSRSPQ